MAEGPLSYWDYVKAAFWKPVRSRVLGAMPLTQMLLVSFGLAGFFNPGFWLLGLAAVVAFVGGRSASERFQKLVEAERLLARQGTAEDRMKAAYERLEPASQARYRALVVLCREILGLGAGAGDGLTDFRAGNLNQLLSLFLRRRGINVIYLGANVPLVHLGDTLKSAAPGMVISVAQTLPGAAALRELAEFLNASEIQLAYGGGIFNQIPALTGRIPGHFLGHELNSVPQIVENLIIHQPSHPTPEPISPLYERTLRTFKEKQALITMSVSQELLKGEIHHRHIDEANHHFTRAITSALALGDIRFLDESVGWLNGLMENYGLAQAQSSQYYTAYHQAVAAHLGDQAGIILEWLAGVHRFTETGTSHA